MSIQLNRHINVNPYINSIPSEQKRWMCGCLSVCMCVHLCVCVYMCACVCVLCMPVYVCMCLCRKLGTIDTFTVKSLYFHIFLVC